MSSVVVSAWPTFKSRLVGSWRVADQTMAFRFDRLPGWTFKAGQFVDITLLSPSETDAEGNVRGFSLASAPDEETLLVATRMRNTAFKRFLGAAPPETEVKIEGPFGDFRLHRDISRPAVMLAGGIGITGVVNYAKRFDAARPKTQYELPGITVEDHAGVPVAVVPLWHAVVTAKLHLPKGDKSALKNAQKRLEKALKEIESVYALNPSGLFIQIAYGLSYFKDYIPASVTDQYMPRALDNGKRSDWTLIDAIKFPKDPATLILERNDISFHFKSDYNEHISDAIRALFHPGTHSLNSIPVENVYVGDLFNVTSIRRGFAGRGMPRIMAKRLRTPGADKIPAGAMLFMGFTSSHVHGLAQGNLPSFETLPGYTDQTPASYFAHGTIMHLSHIAIDLEGWYGLDHKDRLHRMFNPRRTDGPEILSPSQAPETSTFKEQPEADAKQYGVTGHNAQMQFLSRLERDTTTVYGEKLSRGTVIFLRQDFDTVENPFEFDATGPVKVSPVPGVHFIGFAPSAQLFEKMRKEMDGVELQKKHNLANENTGFTKFLITTHRQNYLEPSRSHRSFPLAELVEAP